jgi:acetyltransferase-like isoleucine patch superfamily enzyme
VEPSHPIPVRYTGTLRERFGDWRHERRIHRSLKTDLTPPPPSAFGAFGERSVLVPPTRTDSPARIFIGNDVVIHEGSWLSVVQAHADIVPTLRFGDRSRVGRFCHFACVGEIDIGEDAMISDKVLICDAYHGYEDVTLLAQRQPMSRPRTVVIGARAVVAIGAIILPGVRIGEGAYVADWAVVSRSVPPGAYVAGNPAVPRAGIELGPAVPAATA